MSNQLQIHVVRWSWCLIVTLCLVVGCDRPPSDRVQGYVEGEFVYVASPAAGMLKSLYVYRGTQVKAGDRLYALDPMPEQTGRDEAERRLIAAQADLQDALKGKRPSEIESLEAMLAQARAGLTFSEKDLARVEAAFQDKSVSAQDVDRARSIREQDRQRVAQLEADLATAKLGAREDRVAAAEANVHALQAALAHATWNLSQKQQNAEQAGLVFDTLYREGEWVNAAHPVVVLLPPQNVKVRAFVPEPRLGALHLGDSLRVHIDGVSAPIPGRVSYISPRIEFTPPVIYSSQSREKLAFMIELVFDPAVAAQLHPGQPVDVEIGPSSRGQ